MRKLPNPMIFMLTIGMFFFSVYAFCGFFPEQVKDLAMYVAKNAKADTSQFDVAQNLANNYWQDILQRKAMEEFGLGQQSSSASFDGNFGGQIVFTFPCLCNAKTLFLIRPVSGIAGPYVVYWFPPFLRQFRLVMPGNHVLGRSDTVPTGICSIYVIIWCFNFNAYDVSAVTGMGTSATP